MTKRRSPPRVSPRSICYDLTGIAYRETIASAGSYLSCLDSFAHLPSNLLIIEAIENTIIHTIIGNLNGSLRSSIVNNL